MAKKTKDPYAELNKPRQQGDEVEVPADEPVDEKPEPRPMTGVTTLHTGRELPPVLPREDADPLLVECLDVFRTLQAGGAITTTCAPAHEAIDRMIVKLTLAVKG